MTIVLLFFLLLFLGVPIFAVVLICATSGVFLYSSTSLLIISQQSFAGLDSTTLRSSVLYRCRYSCFKRVRHQSTLSTV